MGEGASERWKEEAERGRDAEEENNVSRRPKEDCRSTTGAVGEAEGCTEKVSVERAVRDGKIFTDDAKRRLRRVRQSVQCIRAATAQLDRRSRFRSSGSGCRCLLRQPALQHAYLRTRDEQPGKYRKIADRVHRLKIGQYFDVRSVGTDERSRNPIPIWLVYGCTTRQGLGARAGRQERARHEGRGLAKTLQSRCAASLCIDVEMLTQVCTQVHSDHHVLTSTWQSRATQSSC